DLLILGVQSARHGTFEIGPVTRGVTDASPCDVLIYATRRNTDFNRVVVPVDGSDHPRVATRIAARIGEGPGVLVEAIHIQSSGHTRWEAHRAIERSLMGIDGEDAIQRTVATASDHVSGLLARLDGDDLLVIGFASREVLEKWLFSHFSTRLL